ncbi:MAG: hypothetical protein OHK0012_17780 [Synechococcales cyanobacterium]
MVYRGWVMVKVVLGILCLWLGWVTPAVAQLSRVEGASQSVYAALPQLPKEDGYVASSGEGTGYSTLMHRMMVYHIQTRGRSPFRRFDWKLTLADYLDLNEVMLAQSYPGVTIFTSNPYDGDRQVIQGLSRAERNALLNALLIGFGATTEPDQWLAPSARPTAPAADPTPSAATTPQPLIIPATGGADLLK